MTLQSMLEITLAGQGNCYNGLSERYYIEENDVELTLTPVYDKNGGLGAIEIEVDSMGFTTVFTRVDITANCDADRALDIIHCLLQSLD